MHDIAFSLLQPCINLGLDEEKFWDMTVAELNRYMNGGIWRIKQRASLDYALANLIGISASRMMSSEVKYPSLEEAYPELFAAELKAEQKRIQEEEIAIKKSTNRFLEFAMKHNAMKRREVGDKT